jgi:D-glycero-D-manno-heptose 1,7-bisphosphate phosphatase
MFDPRPTNQIFWFQREAVPCGRACLFLDRDGVLIEEVAYLHRPAEVRIAEGAAALIRAAHARGFVVGIVSNQSGIGRGRFGWDDFTAVQAEIVSQLDLGPMPFDFVAACGTHPEAIVPGLRILNHSWRKPQPGMLRMAAAAFAVDVAQSVLIGDHVTDLEAGLEAAVSSIS